MKKLLLILILIIPSATMAQYGDESEYSSIITFVVGLLIVGVLFIALRMVMLWYWRIDEIIENQIINNNLLRKILNEQIKENDKTEVK